MKRGPPPAAAGRGGPSGQPQKAPYRGKPKDDDDDYDEMEMDEMIEDEEAMRMDEMLAAADMPAPPDAEPIALLGHKNMGVFEKQWHRPPLPPLDPAADEVVFQIVEVDYTTMQTPPEYACGSTEPKAAVFRIFGVTQGGNSLVAHVHGFKPYFYVRAPPGFTQADIAPFRATLSARIKAKASAKDPINEPVVSMDMVVRQSIMNYTFKQAGQFIRIVMAMPQLVAGTRRELEQGMPVPRSGTHCFETFESNCQFVLRYMVDRDIKGCSWLSIPAGSWKPRPFGGGKPALPGASPLAPTTHAQLEVDLHFSRLVAHAPDTKEWMHIAPIRILSFDIECSGRPGIFPEADKDAVIQIANHVVLQGTNEVVVKNIFCLKECAPISGAQVLSFETEADLLKSWHAFLIACDPDVITGYNIVNFDLPYLLDRAAALKIGSFPFLGRVRGMPTKQKDKMFQSKQVGTRESKEINIEGRVQFDVMQVLQRDYKLSSYSLNAVCTHFLGEQKEDVHHSIITELQNGNSDTRRRLAVYCLKDAYLPQRLLQKLMCIINYVEMARVTGVPLSYLLTRGQQIKVMSQLYRKTRPLGLLLPVAARKQVDGGHCSSRARRLSLMALGTPFPCRSTARSSRAQL